MNFNFREILEMFSGHWKFLAFLILVTATFTGFVIVPLGKSYFESDNYSCGPCLDENKKLVHRVIEISALLREYSELQKAQENMNRSVSEMVVMSSIEQDTIAAPIQVVDNANQQLNRERERLIEKAQLLTDID